MGRTARLVEGSLQLLTSADRTAPARHRSLAATVEWSYRLLEEEDQRVFRRLAVTLEAAVAVAGPDTGRLSCTWSTARCSARPGRGWTAGRGT